VSKTKKVKFENVTIICDVTNTLNGVKYQTSRKNYPCVGCDKRINVKEDYYYTSVDTSLVPRDNESILGKDFVYIGKRAIIKRYHTKCFPARDAYEYLELKKAKQDFVKL